MNKNQISIDKSTFGNDGDFSIYTSTNGGQAKTQVFQGSLSNCYTISAAYVLVGYVAVESK